MRTVQLVRQGKPLETRQVSIPKAGAGDVLIAVKAAGICHSDVHYRAGVAPVTELPITLGHEIAGIVEFAGKDVENVKTGDRVCVHYLITCGSCPHCIQGREQFCASGKMLGKDRDGGYAEYVSVPAENAFLLPDEIPFEHGAVMMCSCTTSYHALRKAKLTPGETVAVFGVGGLGMAAVQLALALGASEVYAVDINAVKLEVAETYGAIRIDASIVEPVEEIIERTGGSGVNIALELVGLPQTMKQAIESLSVFGRAAFAGIGSRTVPIDTYKNLIDREAELIGVSDHLAEEIPQLIELVQDDKIDLSSVVTQTVPLFADEINEVLDVLESFGGTNIRAVIMP